MTKQNAEEAAASHRAPTSAWRQKFYSAMEFRTRKRAKAAAVSCPTP
jgi:hypothetical protein